MTSPPLDCLQIFRFGHTLAMSSVVKRHMDTFLGEVATNPLQEDYRKVYKFFHLDRHQQCYTGV